MSKEIKTIQTSRGELRYYRDWDNYEGGVVMLNPQTIDRYCEIKNDHPKTEDYGCFFAFGTEQFNKYYDAAVAAGRIKEGEKLYSHYSGLYGTHEGITSFLAWYSERDKAIAVECDPQEIYFYEYNNHECMLSWDGDNEVIAIIASYFGEEAAEKIVRL